ncbi:MAG: AAA family ATPase [Proteobacteria bacterium]|nr:AAA family ATPase [Pseudomonadota bacterium]
MIIAFLNQKGGTGKTTLSINVAHALSVKKKNNKVLLVDADPQGSARDWAAAREGKPLFPVIGLDRAVLHKELPGMVPDYDHIIIDGPPRVSELARSAIMAADLVVVPIQPSPYDVWAADEIIKLIKEAAVFKGSIKCTFVVNRKIVNTAIGRDVNDALVDYEFPTAKTAIHQRVIFAESAAPGSTVIEMDNNGQAAKEIKKLANELLEME